MRLQDEIDSARNWLAVETDRLSAELMEAEKTLGEVAGNCQATADLRYATTLRDLAVRHLENHLDLCRQFAAFVRRISGEAESRSAA